MTPRWAAFLGLTVVLLALVLALARLSQHAITVDEPPPGPPADDRRRSPAIDNDENADESWHPEAWGSTDLPGESSADDDDWASHATETHDVSHDPTPSMSTGALLANVAITQGLVAGVLLAGAYYFAIPASAFGVTADPWVTGTPALFLGTVFGVVLWSANEVGAGVADAYGVSYDERVRRLLAPDTVLGWVVLLGLILPIIAVAEELLFRASLIGVAHVGIGVSPWLLAVLSSVAFALGHGAQGRAGVAVTGLLGFVLAAGYVLSGSLLVVVVAHYVVNALEFLVHEGLGLRVGRSVLG